MIINVSTIALGALRYETPYCLSVHPVNQMV